MPLDLNLLRSKSIGPSPAGPLGAKKGSRAAGFIAGRSFGMSQNKKAKAGARAGLGQKGRSYGPSGKSLGVIRVGGSPPRGPGGPGRSPSVTLPTRKRFTPPASSAASAAGFVKGFFKRLRGGR